MKCPECGNVQPGKLGRTCTKCKYYFVFDPKDSGSFGMTDSRFKYLINTASANDTRYFTANQLYATYCSRTKPNRAGWIAFAVVIFVLAALAFFSLLTFPAIVLAILGALCIVKAFRSKPRPISLDKFRRLLTKWKGKRKTPYLIDGLQLTTPPPNWDEHDIYDYGVERLLIVQRDELVDLMVMNNHHAEQRMLVISETGYPQYLLPVARKLLEENLTLPVFLLHDADRSGQGMEERVKKLGLSLTHHQIVDLGMRPEDFRRMKRTESFDIDNRNRELPVDSLMTPLLITGLLVCFDRGVPFGDLLDEHAKEAVAESSFSDFG